MSYVGGSIQAQKIGVVQWVRGRVEGYKTAARTPNDHWKLASLLFYSTSNKIELGTFAKRGTNVQRIYFIVSL